MKNHGTKFAIRLCLRLCLIAMLVFAFTTLSLTGCSNPAGGGGGDGDDLITISDFQVENLKTEFAQNDTFTLGEPPTGAVDVLISFSDGTELTFPGITKEGLEAPGFKVSGYNTANLGPQTVTIKYKDFAKKYTYEITVLPPGTAIISIGTQPKNAVVKAGAITGSLSIAATVSTDDPPSSYQWYSNTINSNTGGTPIGSETSASYTIPTGLTAGSYYYYCVVSATGAADRSSNVAMVTVLKFSGDGTSGTPYLITDLTDLSAMRDLVNTGTAPFVTAYYQLETSTPINTGEWTPIGNKNYPFKGNFNGNKQTITLTVTRSGDYNGLFGYINGIVRNLGVTATVSGNQYNGGIAGYVGADGSISNCYVSGTVSGTTYTGGVAGSVIGNNALHNSNVNNCYSSATVSGTTYVGGIAGLLGTSTEVSRCYATGVVSGTNYLGGVAGQISGVQAKISGCVALNPSITGTGSSVGRITGSGASTLLTNNAAFIVMTVKGVLITNGTASSINGEDIGSVAAKDQGTYSGRGWVFAGTDAPWKMGIGAYTLPVLYWQSAAPVYPAHLTPGMSPLDPFPITSRLDFLKIGGAGSTAAMHYKQTEDITLVAGDWISIPLGGSFTGSYDGNGWEIKSYQIIGRTETPNGIGLFPTIGSGGVVKNLRLTNVSSNPANSSKWDVGALAGINNGRIENCSVTGTSVQGGYTVGGLVGKNDGGVVQNCWTNIAVEANHSIADNATNVGGIAGANSGKIENCYALGAVTGYNSVGGIAGYLGVSAESIKGCVALNASIHATTPTGNANLIGRIAGNLSGVLYNGITACFYRTGLTPTGDGWNSSLASGPSSKNGGEVLAGTTSGYNSETWWANTAVSIGPGFKFGSPEASPWKMVGNSAITGVDGPLPKLWFE